MTVITASPKGFQKLLDLQQKSLDTLGSIQDILSTNTDSVTQQLLQSQLDAQNQSLDLQQKQLSLADKSNDKLTKLSETSVKTLTEIGSSLKNFRTFGDDLHDMKKSFTDTFLGGNFTKSLMSAFNVGGIFNKKIAKEDFIKSQRAAGDNRELKLLEKNFDIAWQLSKEIKKNEQAIADFKKTLGRGRDVTDEQMAQTPGGQDLLSKRGQLAGSYAGVDSSAALFGQGNMTGDEKSAPLPKTPSDFGQLSKSTSSLALETASTKEHENETFKLMQSQTDLLQDIADNIRLMVNGGGSNKKKSGKMQIDENATGGLMDSVAGVFSFMGDMLLNVIGKVFSFRSILKFVTKFFAPAMLIASLANGIIDGFKTFMDTGSISEALIAGFGGMLDFLSFGLFDKDTLKNVIDAVGPMVNDYIVQPVTDFINGVADAFQQYIAQPIQDAFGAMMDFAQNINDLFNDTIIAPIQKAFDPISDFFNSMVDSIMGTLNSIEIPGVSFKLPFKDDPISIGPWHPFSDSKQDSANLSRVTPNTANSVITASQDNEDMKAASKGGGTNTAIVNAPIQNNTNTTQIIKPNIRNAESSQAKYLGARY